MTSALYSRYIPPPPQVLLDVSEKSATSKSVGKKRKRAETRDILPETGVGFDGNHLHQSDDADKHTTQTNSSTGTTDLTTNEKGTEGLSNIPPEFEQRSKKVKAKKKRDREGVSAASPLVESAKVSGNPDRETQVEVNGAESSIGGHNEGIEDNEALEAKSHTDGVADTKHKSIHSKYQRSHSLANLTRTTDAGAESRFDVDNPGTEVELHDLVPLPQPDPVQAFEARPSFSALPPWLAKPIRVSTLDSRPLEDLKLSSKVLTVLQDKGYRTAFAVQTAVLPLLLQGPEQHVGDVCIAAATGSGKTLAYMLPLSESLRTRTVVKLRAVIVVPTRELVTQALEVCELCSTGSGLKIGTAVGNKSLREEQELLVKKTQKYNRHYYGSLQKEVPTEGVKSFDFDFDSDPDDLENIHKALPGHVVDYESNIDVLICTPGRLVDHMRRTKGFNLDHVQWLVIDEADRLLNESFQEWVGTVMKALETKGSLDRLEIRQKLLSKMGVPQEHRSIRKVILSATMTKDVGSLSTLKLHRPRLVVLETTTSEVMHDIGSTADLVEEGGDPGLEETSDGYDLPLTLHEKAVGVGDGSDKPLYLLELLKTHLNMCNDAPLANSSQPPEKDLRTSLSDVTSVAGDAHLTLANQSFDGVPASLHIDQRSTSSSVSETSDTSCRSSPHVDSASRHENPVYPTQGVLIFTNNNENASRLARLLSILHPPYSTTIRTLTKSTSTSSGRQVLSAFRAGKVSVLIASDRASRGLDVPNLRCVINYDIPSSVTGYVHRVGRTARAGKEGLAWTLTAHNEARWFWNEIARGRQIRRAPERKIERVKINAEGLGQEVKTAYAEALKMLGDEAKGKVNRR